MKSQIIVTIFTLCLPMLSFSQGALTICNSFEVDPVYITIDSASVWEMGQPSTTVFNSSYSGLNSIVTDLDSLYPINDSSFFTAVFRSEEAWDGIPNYLDTYTTFEIQFNHRFATNSAEDYGSVELSLDAGDTWYNVLSGEINAEFGETQYPNEHYYEGTGITTHDSIAVFGDSNGWVQSSFSLNVQEIIVQDEIYPDSIIVKFSFITDGIGGNEGWQIDDLCLSMDYIDNVYENKLGTDFSIFPNPNNGEFSIPQNNEFATLEIYNLQGAKVYSEIKPKSAITADLPAGVYMVVIRQEDALLSGRMVVN